MIIAFSAKYLSLELYLEMKRGREKRIFSASIDRLASPRLDSRVIIDRIRVLYVVKHRVNIRESELTYLRLRDRREQRQLSRCYNGCELCERNTLYRFVSTIRQKCRFVEEGDQITICSRGDAHRALMNRINEIYGET